MTQHLCNFQAEIKEQEAKNSTITGGFSLRSTESICYFQQYHEQKQSATFNMKNHKQRENEGVEMNVGQ